MPSSWRPRTPSRCTTPSATPDRETQAWLALLHAAGTERAAWRALLREGGSATALVERSDNELGAAGLAVTSIERLRAPAPHTLSLWHQWLNHPHHRFVPWGSPLYPALLNESPDPPLALWVNGTRPELLRAPQLGVVGSRHATRGGQRTAGQLARYLAERGLSITSGLAAGIDTAGHRGALGSPAGTLAVLGCGIDIAYPASNRGLAEAIAADGLVLSEYPPGVAPRGWRFPARNRIIAALAIGTLVVEAGQRSGALITARLASEYGREVFAVPGSIHNPMTRGCHRLLKQGAKLVENANDIFVELAPLLAIDAPSAAPDHALASPHSTTQPSPAPMDCGYTALLETLGYEPTNIADLAACTGLTAAELSSILLVLEMEGFVEALPGGRYCRMPARSQ